LFLRAGCAVDFGALLVVGQQKLESDAGAECRLAVLARDLNVSAAKTAIASVGVNPAENVPDDELLPGREPKDLAFPFGFVQPQEAEEINGVLGKVPIEAKAALLRVAQIIDVPLGREAYPLRADDLSDSCFARVGFGWMFN
jgi:hypothetical protein